MKRILALDPGETSGYGLIEVERGVRVVTYGIIPRLRPHSAGLVYSVRQWLEWAAPTFNLRGSDCDVAFEEAIQNYKAPTRTEAAEVRGVIREWCAINKPVDSFAYTPTQIRLQLGLPLKGTVKSDMRMWVERALGYKPCGPDHVTDALGIALCHALKIGAWHATIRQPERAPARSKGEQFAGETPQRSGERVDEDRMTSEEFRRKLASGELVHTGKGLSFVERGRR